MFGSPIGKIDIADDLNIDLEKLRHIALLAPIFNCHAVRVFSYFNKSERPYDEWQAESLGRLSALKNEAKSLGLVLYHENEHLIFGDKCADVLKIATLRDENFRLIFDFDNYNQTDDDAWQNWQQLKDVTDAFHLKDSTKEKQHVPIGQGAGYAREILTDAAQNRWTGRFHWSHISRIQTQSWPRGRAESPTRNLPA